MHLASTGLEVWVLQGLSCCWALAGLRVEQSAEEIHCSVRCGTVLSDAVEEWMLGHDALLLCCNKSCYLQPPSIPVRSEPFGKCATPKSSTFVNLLVQLMQFHVQMCKSRQQKL